MSAKVTEKVSGKCAGPPYVRLVHPTIVSNATSNADWELSSVTAFFRFLMSPLCLLLLQPKFLALAILSFSEIDNRLMFREMDVKIPFGVIGDIRFSCRDELF